MRRQLKPKPDPEQSKRFLETAREVGANEAGEAFELRDQGQRLKSRSAAPNPASLPDHPRHASGNL